MDEATQAILFVGVLTLVGFSLGIPAGCELGNKRGIEEVRNEAVSAGHAEYYLDANHDKQFRWKPTPNAAKQQEASE